MACSAVDALILSNGGDGAKGMGSFKQNEYMAFNSSARDVRVACF